MSGFFFIDLYLVYLNQFMTVGCCDRTGVGGKDGDKLILSCRSRHRAFGAFEIESALQIFVKDKNSSFASGADYLYIFFVVQFFYFLLIFFAFVAV